MENNHQQKDFQISVEYSPNQKIQKLFVSGEEKFVSEKYKEITENDNKKEEHQHDSWKQYSLLMFALVGLLISFIIECRPTPYETLFWIIALTWSGFLGVYAYDIHTVLNLKNERIYYKDVNLPTKIHQFIFNFGLALFGWFVAWFLFFYKDLTLDILTTPHLILLGVSLISLSGYLPSILSRGNPFK